MGEFGAGRQNAPGAGDNPDSQIGFQLQHLGLQKSHDGSEQFEQDDDQQ